MQIRCKILLAKTAIQLKLRVKLILLSFDYLCVRSVPVPDEGLRIESLA